MHLQNCYFLIVPGHSLLFPFAILLFFLFAVFYFSFIFGDFSEFFLAVSSLAMNLLKTLFYIIMIF